MNIDDWRNSPAQRSSNTPSVFSFEFQRIFIFLGGVIGPVVAVTMGLVGLPLVHQPWQSGATSDFAMLLVQYPTIMAFLPQILYSIGCLGIWCFYPKACDSPLIRLGIYSGTLVTLQFLIIVSIFEFCPAWGLGMMLIPALAFFAMILQFFLPRLRRFSVKGLLVVTALVALVLTIFGPRESVAMISGTSLAFALCLAAGSPMISFLVFGFASIWCTQNHESHRPMTRWFIWLTGWLTFGALSGVSWRLAIQSVVVEYSKLPTEDPNCFVCSAAAHGNRWVNAQSVSTPDGRRYRLNAQMQWLKFLELALQVLMPRSHRCVRNAYNRWGPAMARNISGRPKVATMVYFLLKPVELFAWTMAQFSGTSTQAISQIYRVPGNDLENI